MKTTAKALTAILFVSYAMGCAPHSTIVRFDKPAEKVPAPQYPPTNPQTVGIYRVAKPFPFQELGLISFRTEDYFSLPTFYDQLRQDAAAQGADAVLDFRVTSETHVETVWERRCIPRTQCDTNGICHTEEDCTEVPVTKDVTTFLGAGTMVRRKQ